MGLTIRGLVKNKPSPFFGVSENEVPTPFGGVLLACFMRGYCRSGISWIMLACVPPLCDVTYGVMVGPFAFLSVGALACCVIVWAGANMERPVMLRPLIWPGRRCYALY